MPLWGRFETQISNETPYGNKFRDVDLTAVFTAPSGRTVRFWGFFDGDGSGGGDRLDVRNFPRDNAGETSGTVWKLRFMPDEIGRWTYRWSFSDGSRSGAGAFVSASADARPGVFRVLRSNPLWLEDGTGRPFFPKPAYILAGDQLPYPTRSYGPQVYDKLIAKGFNLIVTNLFPVWNWTTHQVHLANGPADINLMLWYQRDNYHSGDRDETPDTRIYDTDRMNLFTWKRIEDHIGYLARRGIVTWGFQGFAVKRSFGIRPQHFPDDKGRWYMRYVMARLAPYWNVIWHHTWESSEGADKFRKWIGEYDPWRHLYFQVDAVHPRYDIAARDGKPKDMPRYYRAGRPIWMTEDHGPLWGYDRHRTGGDSDAAMDKAWSLVMQGATAYWTEWAGRRRFSDVATATVVDHMAILYNFIGDETDFAKLKPHRELVDAGAYALANPGHQYVVYKPGGGGFAVRLEKGAYSVIWLDPRDGRRRNAGTVNGGRDVSFTTPASKSFALFLNAR